MRISDWSSDVCSSDLRGMARLDPIEEDDGGAEGGGAEMFSPLPLFVPRDPSGPEGDDRAGSDRSSRPGQVPEAGASSDGAQDRKRVVGGKWVAGRVDLEGRSIFKKKKERKKMI